ncbi:unnamed protein product [Urochloa decumbens]|uniref:Uncharacterized protein n=1 Tax=Urochloa decumbens TaxID=240449 RepID=A0ABC9EC72_9POAL
MSTSSAAKSVSTWNGVTSMLPLASAILADSFWDRYSTITVSSSLYIAGLVGLASWAVLYSRMPRSLLFLPLYLISVGQGGYNPSLQAFGADQLRIDDTESVSAEEKNQVKSLFFQWWYFGICSGSLLGNSIMSYIQDTCGWGLGFTIPCGVMILSVIVFCCGTALYTHKEQNTANKPSESIFKVLKEVVTYILTRKVRLLARADDNSDISELELEEKALKDEFTDPREVDNGREAPPAPNVTETILRLLLIWTTLLIFAVDCQQPMTFFTNQGMLMNHKEEKGITVLQRTGIGMVLSVVAMVVAAIVELKRLRLASNGDATQLSISWLLPQYILLGVADVFTVVGMQEFFYTQVPSTMRTIGIALYLSVFGFGSFLGSFLISVLETTTARMGEGHGWFSDDPMQERLDKYYLFLALLSTISFVFFTYLCKHYNDPEAPAPVGA